MANLDVQAIQIRGARVHNLKNVNVDIPLNKIVGIAGVSGSGNHPLHLAWSMLKVQGAILIPYQPTRADA